MNGPGTGPAQACGRGAGAAGDDGGESAFHMLDAIDEFPPTSNPSGQVPDGGMRYLTIRATGYGLLVSCRR